MFVYQSIKSFFVATVSIAALATGACSAEFNIPQGDLKSALSAYAVQTGTSLVYVVSSVQGVRTRGVQGNLSSDDALARILKGTGFVTRRYPSGAIGIDRDHSSRNEYEMAPDMVLAQAAPPPRAAVETVTVTSSKLGGADVQSIPIAITALSQEQLTSTQTAGGPDLVKQVPNLTFTKTNFTGYSIQIRGIGTQAISVSTDPAVAVALNDVPFIRNHFFEQEFYDVGQLEVLRGPQGTLYGRNATAGVVNVISAKPTDQFEAMASGDIGNYKNRRFEGMINLPIIDDRLDLRIAGEWTKRDGYSFNDLTNSPIDGRDLWSGRATLGWKSSENLQVYLVWEHFQEGDDRLRSSKQLCKTDPGPSEIGGVPVKQTPGQYLYGAVSTYLSQGCLPTSLYSADAFEVPNPFALPYVGAAVIAHVVNATNNADASPYISTTQSRDLRTIESALNPRYITKNDTVELNSDYKITPDLTLTSQTGFNQDFLWSTEDYNRFAARPSYFAAGYGQIDPTTGQEFPVSTTLVSPDGILCDPQLGCSDRLVAQDLSEEHAWQLSQEFRLASKFDGPLNFSVGGNYLHYETEENYYVFINTLTALAAVPAFGGATVLPPWQAGVSDNHQCLSYGSGGGYVYPNTQNEGEILQCGYIDPNPITSLNNQGHNYFLSQNPYVLNSYAGFGEVYYDLAKDLKLTGGLRWTDDQKHFVDIPSELLVAGYGYPISGVVNQEWRELTGRGVVNWTPKLDFTDQTLIYGSFSRGYKAGGANPPGAVLLVANINGNVGQSLTNPIHPLTFKPEFINAHELGTKNSLMDGSVTLNGDIFFYKYKDYQISEIVDRTALNLNFDAHVKGAEVEATWELIPGLRFNFTGGYEDARLANGSKAVDLMDRTAGDPDWVVVKPFITQTSNCILPTSVMAVAATGAVEVFDMCAEAYQGHINPVAGVSNVNFDPTTAPNNGEGFDKNLSGNQLPNAPNFTTSLSADYTLPISGDWAATLHSDFYWQSDSYARIFNDRPYDQIHGYTTTNFALILTSENGWKVMGYLKNAFNVTAITGSFLNSDDSGLTTNVFLTDPRLFGIRVTRNW